MLHEERRNVDALAQAIVEKICEVHPLFCPLDPERRQQDHDWVLLRRQKELERIEFYKALRLHLAKWSVIGVAIFVAVSVWQRTIFEIGRVLGRAP